MNHRDRAPRLVVNCFVCVVVLGCAATDVQAQGTPPPGPFVVDLRAGGSALPRDAPYFPSAPSGTLVPSSGFAIDAGAHVYLISLGPARIGFGAGILRTGGRTSPQATSSAAGSSTAAVARPRVETRLTSVTPQVSFNFGSSAGWSYISAGMGPARVRTTVASFQEDDDGVVRTIPETSFEPSLRDMNLGAGARWFTNSHFAISFDVRFHVVSGGSGDAAPPRSTLAVATAGMSFK